LTVASDAATVPAGRAPAEPHGGAGVGRVSFQMKAFLVNLLVLFSVVLCGFNAVQWYREAKLHGRNEGLAREIYRKSTEIQNLQQTVKIHEDDIKRLEHIRETFGTTLKSNRTVIAQLQDSSVKFERESLIWKAKAEHADKAKDQYREAFDKANDNIKKQNEVIQKQNEKMLEIANAQKDVVERYNKLATDYKGLGDDYQKLLGMYTNLVNQVQAANEKSAKR
jgi:chromosome segregation ATPase